MPPAPPNATSANRRGSCPRSTDTTRMARSMLALATRTMPSASSCTRQLRALAPAPAAARCARARHRAPCGRRERTPDRAGRAAGWRRSPSARRPCRSRPARDRARAPGPTRSAPPLSTYAIDPPPAPTVWMSITGSRTGKSPTSSPSSSPIVAVDQADVRGRPAHVEGDDALEPGRRGDRRARRPRPPPGPDRIVRTACARAAAAEMRAAVRLHDRQPRAGQRRPRASRGSDRSAASHRR